jgi:hypothetical protein
VLEKDRVAVQDTLTNPSHIPVEAISLGNKFSMIHMGSARYFQAQELEAAPLGALARAAEALSKGELRRAQDWSFE